MTAPTPISGLGYLLLRSARLDDWADFGARLLGLQPVRDGSRALALRMDEAERRLILDDGRDEGVAAYGWEVRDAAALETLAARLDAAGHAVAALTPGETERRAVATGIATTDPAGNRVEFFHGQHRAARPFVAGRAISGFRTGRLGMGHAVLQTPRLEALLSFYRELLGFRVSDFTNRPFRAVFLHANTRHHSLALIENAHGGLHHLMIELGDLDDVGQGYDLALLEPGRVAATLGRHSNDHMLSFYLRTPSGFLIEYGWGGRSIDPDTWTAEEMTIGPSLWGHERDWLGEDLAAEARKLRLAAAAAGIRAPIAPDCVGGAG